MITVSLPLAIQLYQAMEETFGKLESSTHEKKEAWWKAFIKASGLSRTILRQELVAGIKNESVKMSQPSIRKACNYIKNKQGDELYNKIMAATENKTTVSQELAIEFSEIPKAYLGTYEVYWLNVGKYSEIDVRYTININSKGVVILDNNMGGMAEFKNGCLYLYFDNKPDIDRKRMLIVRFGSETLEHSKYVSALFLSTNSDNEPVSGPMLLVRKDNEPKNQRFICKFFEDKFPNDHKFKAIRNTEVMNLYRNVKHGKKNRDEGLLGNWYIYVWGESNTHIIKAKVQIESRSKIKVFGEKNEFEGKLELLSHNFVINIRFENRLAQFIGHIGGGDTAHSTWVPCSFSIIALNTTEPEAGLGIMERVENDSNFLSNTEVQRFSEEQLDELPSQVRLVLKDRKNLIAPTRFNEI